MIGDRIRHFFNSFLPFSMQNPFASVVGGGSAKEAWEEKESDNESRHD